MYLVTCFMMDRYLSIFFQVVEAHGMVMVDWAYKNGGIQSSTGHPDVTLHWEGWERLVVGGEALMIDQ